MMQQKCSSTEGCWEWTENEQWRSFKANGNRKDTYKLDRTFLEHIMRKKRLKNLTITWNIKGKRDRRKRYMTKLTSLCKWLREQRLGLIAKSKKKKTLLRAITDKEKPWSSTPWRDTAHRKRSDKSIGYCRYHINIICFSVATM